MKRMLCFILSIIMLCSVTAVVFSEEEAEEVQNEYFYEGEFLKAIGIVDDTENLDSPVTRRELAKWVANICYNTEVPQDYTKNFSDVDGDKYINAVYAQNLMTGEKDGRFLPNNAVSSDEALKVMVKLLRQDMFNEYKQVSSKLNLMKGIKETDKLIKRDMYKLLYNTLFAECMTIEINTSETVSYTSSQDVLLINKYMNIYEVKGSITDNGITAIDGESNINEDTVKIGDKVYYKSDTNAEEYLGFYITGYYKEIDDEYYLVWVDEPNESKNTFITINAKDIEYADLEKIEYYVGNRVKTAKISLYANYIKNGKYTSSLTNEDVNSQTAIITLIATDNKNVYNIVKIDVYEAFLAKSINKTEYKIIDMFGKTHEFSDETKVYGKDGEPVDFEKIAPYDVLACYQVGDDYRLEICTDAQYAEIASVNLTDNILTTTEKDELIIADEYIQNSNVLPKLGEEGTIYTDLLGRIIYFEKANTENQSGVLLRLYEEEVEPDKVWAKIFTQDGEMKNIYFKEKIKFNNVSVKPRVLLNNNIFYEDDAEFIRQVILYKTNREGEISHLYTTQDWNESEVILQTAGNLAYTYRRNGIHAYYMNTKIEGVPRNLYINTSAINYSIPLDASRDDLYKVTTGVKDYTDNTSRTFTAFFTSELSKKMSRADITLSFTGDESVGHREAVVENIVSIVNEKDEIVDKLIVLTEGQKKEYYSKPGVNINGLKRGDVIKIAESEGELLTYVKQYSAAMDMSSLELLLDNFEPQNCLKFWNLTTDEGLSETGDYINKTNIYKEDNYKFGGRINDFPNTYYQLKGVIVDIEGDYAIVKEHRTGEEHVLMFAANSSAYYKTYFYEYNSKRNTVNVISQTDVNIGDEVLMSIESLTMGFCYCIR